MAANFEGLCSAVCELIGVQVPRLERDTAGLTAFTVDRGQGEVSVAQRHDMPGMVIVIANLGRVADDHDSLACSVLMEVNFLMLGRPESPCLARNPLTREFMLHYTRKLDELSATELYAAVERMEQVIHNWQGGAILRQGSAAQHMTSPANLA